MTRKEYVANANAIKAALDQNTAPENGVHRPDREIVATRTALYDVAKSLANTFYDDNPRFDRKRFMVACGFDA